MSSSTVLGMLATAHAASESRVERDADGRGDEPLRLAFDRQDSGTG